MEPLCMAVKRENWEWDSEKTGYNPEKSASFFTNY
jgi:hypothetical protein